MTTRRTRYEVLFRDEAGLICYSARSRWEEACRVLVGRRRDDKLGMWRDGRPLNPLSWRRYVSRLERTLELSSGEIRAVMRR